MEIEIRDLRWIIAVSEHGSLRQTAKALNIPQPVLSRRLRTLEIRLGVTLFERDNCGTRSTPEGLEFLVMARRIHGDVDDLLRKLKGRSSRHRYNLCIGVQASPSAGNMPALLGEFTRRFPATDIRLVDGGCQRLLDGVRAGTVDVAIVTGSGARWSDPSLDLWSERVVAALPAHHPLASRQFIQWRDLCATPLLLPEHGPGADLHQRLCDRLAGHPLPTVLHHDAALDRILALVRGGFGVLLMLEGATGVQYEGVIYREVRNADRPERLEFRACWSAANRKSALTNFLATLRERHPDLAPPDFAK